MTQLVQAPRPPSVPTISEIQTIEQIAASVAKTAFVPRAYQGKPGDILAAALYGREFGWPLMVSLQYLSVIQGKPTMSAEAMAARIRQLGHSLQAVEWTDQVCTLRGRHALTGDEEVVSFTIEDAQRAGLNGDNWRKYPKAMLRARATTMIARALFADAIMGVSYSPEEIGGAVDVEVIEVTEEVSASHAITTGESPAVPERPAIPDEVTANGRPLRRKVAASRGCPDCSGYGCADDGAECDACVGTGKRDDISPDRSGLGDDVTASGDDDDPLPFPSEKQRETLPGENAIWRALMDDTLPYHALATDGVHIHAEDAADQPLSIDVTAALLMALVKSGKALDARAAGALMRDRIAHSPGVLNAWALQKMELIRAGVVV